MRGKWLKMSRTYKNYKSLTRLVVKMPAHFSVVIVAWIEDASIVMWLWEPHDTPLSEGQAKDRRHALASDTLTAR